MRKLNCHNVYVTLYRLKLKFRRLRGQRQRPGLPSDDFQEEILGNLSSNVASRLCINHSSRPSPLFRLDANRTEEEIESTKQSNFETITFLERSPTCFVSWRVICKDFLALLFVHPPISIHIIPWKRKRRNRATNSTIIIINAKRVSAKIGKLQMLLHHFFLSI